MSDDGQRGQLPQWVLIAGVLGSGALTAWAMWKTQATGPQTSWGRVENAVGEIWAQPTSALPAQNLPAQTVPAQPLPAQTVAGARPLPMMGGPMMGAPMMGAPMTAAGTPLTASMVARVRGAPAILWGTNRPHGDRGTCTQCHSVLQSNGGPVPIILSSAPMPHGFRGICTNCHTVQGNGPVGPMPVAMANPPAAGLTAQPMVAQLQRPVPRAAAPPTAMPQAAIPRGAQPQEVEWRGLETRAGAQGVMVSAVDGTARRAGVLPGDIIVSLNGGPVGSMAQLEALTNGGRLPRGTVIVLRGGQRMAFELRRGPGVGIAAPQRARL